MLPNRSSLLLVGLLGLLFASSLTAKGQVWDFLGYTHIDTRQDHSQIQIARRDRSFRTIQLRVSGEAIFFDRLIVYFRDGSRQEHLISGRIRPGAANYIIDLPGELRVIESVELWYYKEAWSQNPTVCLYGVRPPESDAIETAQAN